MINPSARDATSTLSVTETNQPVALDLHAEHFACFGGFMALGYPNKSWGVPGLILRSPQGGGVRRELLRLQLWLGGQAIEPEVTATPVQLTMRCGESHADVAFQSPQILRLNCHGVGLRLTSLPRQRWNAVQIGRQTWRLSSSQFRAQYELTMICGSIAVERTDSEMCITCSPDQSDCCELAIRETFASASMVDFPPFRQAIGHTISHWQRWLSALPTVRGDLQPAAARAAYVNWAAVVGPGQLLRRPTMLMSKNVMNNCWTWDACFNAIALSRCDGLADLAWDQLMVPFDFQDAAGCLPDAVCSYKIIWYAVKPPIHGWTLRKMRQAMTVTSEQLTDFYPKLVAWTRWWLDYRDTNDDGLPEYFNGCDSGWDNATLFDTPCPITTPDLPAFLVIQMDVLAELADELGLSSDAVDWKRQADAMLARLLAMWNGEQFQSIRPHHQHVQIGYDCLLNHMPIVLGRRLPQPYRDRLAAILRAENRFLTPFGLATQDITSDEYGVNGYWRGPIWAPVVALIHDGLSGADYQQQANDLAERFCDMCKASGFAENYEATTGRPLCDPAYTWASSVFLVLARDLSVNVHAKSC